MTKHKTNIITKIGISLIIFPLAFLAVYAIILELTGTNNSKPAYQPDITQGEKNVFNALVDEKPIATNYINTENPQPTNNYINLKARMTDCSAYTSAFQTRLDKRREEAESYDVFGNRSYIRESFFSKKLNTCVASVEIINAYQKPIQKRMYAYDTIKGADLFSTSAYDAADSTYNIRKAEYQVQVDALK